MFRARGGHGPDRIPHRGETSGAGQASSPARIAPWHGGSPSSTSGPCRSRRESRNALAHRGPDRRELGVIPSSDLLRSGRHGPGAPPLPVQFPRRPGSVDMPAPSPLSARSRPDAPHIRDSGRTPPHRRFLPCTGRAWVRVPLSAVIRGRAARRFRRTPGDAVAQQNGSGQVVTAVATEQDCLKAAAPIPFGRTGAPENPGSAEHPLSPDLPTPTGLSRRILPGKARQVDPGASPR